MNGLLDFLNDDSTGRSEARLALASGLLNGRGSSISRLATGMQGYNQALAQAKREEDLRKAREQELQMREMQMQEAKRAQEAAALAAQQRAKDQGLMRSLIGMPVEQDMPQGQMGPGVPQRNAGIDPRAFLNQGGSFESLPGAMALSQAMQPKGSDYKVVGNSLVEIGSGGVREAYRPPETPKEVAPTTLARLIAERDSLPPGHPNRRLYDQEIAKQTTHAPAAMAISYGSPVPVQLPGGGIGYAQPGNREGAPPQMMNGPDGRPMQKPPEPDKPLTEGQAKATTFASRMLAADKVLATLSRKGTDTSIPGSTAGFGVGDVINAVSSPEQQMLGQAKRDFINATLRRESGAVISDGEFKNAEKQYFPQVGDSREVKEQKARNRRIAIEGIRADVPKNMQSQVDRISNGGAMDDDPLGLRGGR